MLTGRLSNVLDQLGSLIIQRNEMLEDFRKAQQEGQHLGEVYYGFTMEGGADQRYKNVVENLVSINDDAIYFSKLIGDDLQRYTVALRSTLPHDMRTQAPVVVSANFSKRDDVMPDAAKYAEFEAMFQDVRAFGAGPWHGRFEHLAIEQYRDFSLVPVFY